MDDSVTSRLDARSSALVRQAWAPAVVLAADGRVIEWNSAAERCFGWARAEVIGQPLRHNLLAGAGAAGAEAWLATLAPGQGAQASAAHLGTLGGLHRSGRVLSLEVSGFSDGEGEARLSFLSLREAAPAQAATHPATPWRGLRQVTNTLPVAIAYFDRQQHCQFINDAARRLFGLGDQPGAALTLPAVLGAATHERVQPLLDTVDAGRKVSFMQPGQPGRAPLEVHLFPDCDEAGATHGFCLVVFDNSELAAAELARAEGARHLKSITDHVPALITYVDHRQHVTFANATFKTWLGIDPAQMVGQHLKEVLGAEMYEKRRDFIRRGLEGEQLSFELPTRALGTERELRTTYIPDRGADGRVAGLVVLVTDISAMKSVERQLDQLARIDALTQLPNRRDLEQKLQASFDAARFAGMNLAVMFLDVDHFKPINDTHGHAVGDAVLVEFAARLRRSVRRTDTVARFAGDEFVVVLEGFATAAEVSLVAAKVCSAVREPMAVGRLGLQVSASVGVAVMDAADTAPDDLLRRADEAVYTAKRAGRDGFAVHPGSAGGVDPPR